jgi:hypothetical protein
MRTTGARDREHGRLHRGFRFGPVFTKFVTARITRPTTPADQQALADALDTIEDHYPFSPDGVPASTTSTWPTGRPDPAALLGVRAHRPLLRRDAQEPGVPRSCQAVRRAGGRPGARALPHHHPPSELPCATSPAPCLPAPRAGATTGVTFRSARASSTSTTGAVPSAIWPPPGTCTGPRRSASGLHRGARWPTTCHA